MSSIKPSVTCFFLSMQIKDEALESNSESSDGKDQNPWIGLVPVQMEEGTVSTNNNQESFAASVVNKVFKSVFVKTEA